MLMNAIDGPVECRLARCCLSLIAWSRSPTVNKLKRSRSVRGSLHRSGRWKLLIVGEEDRGGEEERVVKWGEKVRKNRRLGENERRSERERVNAVLCV